MFLQLLTLLTITFSPLDYTYYNEHLYVPMQCEEKITPSYYYHYKPVKKEEKKYIVYESSKSVTRTDKKHYHLTIPENIVTKNISGSDVVVLQPIFTAPPSKNKICQYCNGTGWINDYGNGELYTGNWYFYVNGYYDGHSCTNTVAYHDECDQETYGETYHHFYKTKCPFCGGTGYNGRANSNWTTWYGSGWTHLFTDYDNNGHCDDHQWHEIVPVGDAPVLFLLLLFGLSICYIRDKQNR